MHTFLALLERTAAPALRALLGPDRAVLSRAVNRALSTTLRVDLEGTASRFPDGKTITSGRATLGRAVERLAPFIYPDATEEESRGALRNDLSLARLKGDLSHVEEKLARALGAEMIVIAQRVPPPKGQMPLETLLFSICAATLQRNEPRRNTMVIEETADIFRPLDNVAISRARQRGTF